MEIISLQEKLTTLEDLTIPDELKTNIDKLKTMPIDVIFCEFILVPLIKYIFNNSPYNKTSANIVLTENSSITDFENNSETIDLTSFNSLDPNDSVYSWEQYSTDVEGPTPSLQQKMYFKFRTLLVDFLLLVINDFLNYKKGRGYIIYKKCGNECSGDTPPSTPTTKPPTKPSSKHSSKPSSTSSIKHSIELLVVGSVNKTSDYDISLREFELSKFDEKTKIVIEKKHYAIEKKHYAIGVITNNIAKINAILQCLLELKQIWQYIYTTLFISGKIDDMNTLFNADFEARLSSLKYDFRFCTKETEPEPSFKLSNNSKINLFYSYCIEKACGLKSGDLFDTNCYSHDLFYEGVPEGDIKDDYLPGLNDYEVYTLKKSFLELPAPVKPPVEPPVEPSLLFEFRNALLLILDNEDYKGYIKDKYRTLKNTPDFIQLLEEKSNDFQRLSKITIAERKRRDSLQNTDVDLYNEATKILTLADETYIALSTIYVVVFGLQSKNPNVIEYLLTPEGSVACYVSALDNFGHLLKLLNENKPVSKYAKYIARITNGLDNYMFVKNSKSDYKDAMYIDTATEAYQRLKVEVRNNMNINNAWGKKKPDPPTKITLKPIITITPIEAFGMRGQQNQIINKLKHGHGYVQITSVVHSSVSLKNLWNFLDKIPDHKSNLDTSNKQKLVRLLLSCFQEANSDYYKYIFKKEPEDV